jgi:hypothetical protein
MSIGGSNITTDGLIFSIDANNLKSYNPIPVVINGVVSSTFSGFTGFGLNRVYDSTQQPTIIGISGNVQAAWHGYIAGSGTVAVHLTGGATAETYYVDHAWYDAPTNVTALYQFSGSSVTMSHTSSTGNWYAGSQNFVKISGDLSSIFNIYLDGTLPIHELVLSMTGGGPTTYAVGTTAGASYSGFAMNRVYDSTQQPIVVYVPGYSQPLWDGLITSGGGTATIYLSGGATAEAYDINNVYYNMYTDNTILYQMTPNSVTMSHTCSMGLFVGFYPNQVQMSGVDLEGVFAAYLLNGGYALTLNLSGGSIPESFVVGNVYYDGVDTWLYDGALAGALYNDHTQFEVVVKEIKSTQYTDNIIITYSYLAYAPESYTIQNVYYDISSTSTYLHDSSYIGYVFNTHTEFIVTIPEITNILYNDNTLATGSYTQTIVSTVSYDLSSGGHNGSIINGLGVNSDSRYFVMDGIDDVITTTLVVEPSSNSNLQSYCGWMKYSPGGYNSWFGTDASSGGQHHLVVLWSSYPNQIQVGGSYYGGGGGEGNDFAAVTNANSNGYDHVCYIKTAAYTYDLYLNGVLVMNNITKTSIYPSNFNLGKWYSGQMTKANIPMVYIYNRALTADEVRYNYEQTKWRFNSL